MEKTIRSLRSYCGLSTDSALTRSVRPLYDRLLSGLYREGLRRELASGQVVRIQPRFRYVDDQYERQVFDFLGPFIRSGQTVLEIGAHIGIFTVIFSRWVGEAGHVYAVEPTPSTGEALKEHLRLNQVQGNVTLLPMAVSDYCGTATFFAAAHNCENTLLPSHHRVPTAEPLQVPVTTVDALCSSRQIVPDVIKIDIEGFELHALRGAKETIAAHRPLVVVEMHPMYWAELGVTRAAFESLLDEMSYHAVSISGDQDPFAQYGHVALKPLP